VTAARFDGVTAIVTGAAGGMGAVHAAQLVEAGAHVVVADVLDREGRQVADALGPRARFVHLDVSDAEQWSAAVELPGSWPALRGLVNNAGIHHSTPIERETAEAALALWRVNLLGPMLGMQHVIAPMRAAGGGSIVNVASAAGLVGLAASGAYGASKWGLRGLTRTAALELGPDGIRVNCVLPGYIDTGMLTAAAPAGAPAASYAHLPLGRAGQPGDLVGAVQFLLSDESRYVTGAEVVVDGGLTAGLLPRQPVPTS
jgi:3alpha(or 20beta)-hydroxysteroid dehydrogenase